MKDSPLKDVFKDVPFARLIVGTLVVVMLAALSGILTVLFHLH